MKNNKSVTTNQVVESWELINYLGKTVCLHGSIYKVRKMKGFSFVLLRTKRDVVQCIALDNIAIPAEESCVCLTANVVKEERSRVGYELQIQIIKTLSTPKETMPIVINQKLVNTSLDNLLDYRPLTLRNEKQRAIFKLQEGICKSFRDFLSTNQQMMVGVNLFLLLIILVPSVLFMQWIVRKTQTKRQVLTCYFAGLKLLQADREFTHTMNNSKK